MNKDFNEPVQIPINGILDLHTFHPREVASLVPEYILACHEQGIFELRIIHGKGKGILRARVLSILEKHPLVHGFETDSGPSGWGVTLVYLKRKP